MRRLIFLSAVLLLTGCISIDLTRPVRPLREKTVEGTGLDKILLLDLSGVIAEEEFSPLRGRPEVSLVARVKEELKKASEDDAVKAVVVRINSPGGTATASDILYRELTAFKAKRKVKIVSAIMDVGASGGYYVALAGDKIVAHPTSVTGSIGVIMVTVSVEGLLQKIGVAPTTIKSGERKDMGSPFRGLTEEERRIFQGVIDQLHERFVEVIAKERKGLSVDAVRRLADGRIYTAPEAKQLGLVDEVVYLDDAVALARKEAKLESAQVIMYHRPREYRSNIYSTLASAPEPPGGPLLSLPSLLLGAGPRFLYLWWP